MSLLHTLSNDIMDFNRCCISFLVHFPDTSSGLLMIFPHPYFALVPGLCLLSAAGCDLLVLGFDLGYDLLHVQAAAVVHLHHHRGVFDAGLQLTQLLAMGTKDGL